MASRKRSAVVPAGLDGALAAKGWVQVSGGAGGEPWIEGMTLEGVLVGIVDSTFENDDGSMAKLVTLRVDGMERTMRCPTILQNRLERLSEGDPVRITCLGKTRTGAGRKAWSFDVLAKPQHGLKAAVRVVKSAGRPKGSRNKPKSAKAEKATK